jgi:CheY-like chemotaxis protein
LVCVLLVEEEANVRLGVAEWLCELGYRVVEAQAPQLWSCSGAPPT